MYFAIHYLLFSIYHRISLAFILIFVKKGIMVLNFYF